MRIRIEAFVTQSYQRMSKMQWRAFVLKESKCFGAMVNVREAEL